MTLLSCWILITLLNFDTILSRNSTGRRYVDGSEFHVELWPGVNIPRWILTPGQNSTLNYDPGSEIHIKLWSEAQVTIQRLIMTRGHNSMWNSDLGSYFNVESRPGVTFFNVDSWPGADFQRGILTRVTIQHRIMTRDHISTWNYDPGSQFNVELWPGVTIQRGIMTPGHNSTLNCDPYPGSWFNVESWLGVNIQRGIKTWGHNSKWNQDLGVTIQRGPNFIRRRGRNTMTPCLGWSHFNMKNPLNPEHSPLNQDPTGRNSTGSKFNPTPVTPKWDRTEMLTVFSSWEQRLYEFRFVWIQKNVGEKRGAICTQWNSDCLLEDFSGKNHENIVN